MSRLIDRVITPESSRREVGFKRRHYNYMMSVSVNAISQAQFAHRNMSRNGRRDTKSGTMAPGANDSLEVE